MFNYSREILEDISAGCDVRTSKISCTMSFDIKMATRQNIFRSHQVQTVSQLKSLPKNLDSLSLLLIHQRCPGLPYTDLDGASVAFFRYFTCLHCTQTQTTETSGERQDMNYEHVKHKHRTSQTDRNRSLLNG